MSELKIGMIGYDTSHVIAFADLFNNPDNPHYVPGGRVVCGWPGGSKDMPVSIDRVDGFKKDLEEKHGLKTLDSIEAVAEASDAVLLESVDGRVHLEQFEKLAPAGKPVFIDKPFTVALDDAKAICELAQKHNVPFFSTSSLRYDANICKAITDGENGAIVGCETYGPAHFAPPTPGLFWYGCHSADVLFSAMGPGCKSVTCLGNDDVDVVVGKWQDGRIGVLRGLRKGHETFGCLLYREKAIQQVSTNPDIPYYAELCRRVMAMFQGGNPPITPQEMTEVVAFLEAANTSKTKGGKEIEITL